MTTYYVEIFSLMIQPKRPLKHQLLEYSSMCCMFVSIKCSIQIQISSTVYKALRLYRHWLHNDSSQLSVLLALLVRHSLY